MLDEGFYKDPARAAPTGGEVEAPEQAEQMAARSSFRVTRNAKGQFQFELKIVSVTNEPAEVERAFRETIALTDRMADQFPYGPAARRDEPA